MEKRLILFGGKKSSKEEDLLKDTGVRRIVTILEERCNEFLETYKRISSC